MAAAAARPSAAGPTAAADGSVSRTSRPAARFLRRPARRSAACGRRRPYRPPGFPPPGFPPPAGYLPPPLYSSYPAPRSSDGMAIGSLVSSLIALPLYFICFVFGPAGSLLGIILGIVALAQSKGRPQTNGRNMAIAGIVIGAITLIVGLVGFVVLVDWASRQDPTL
ncbi:DUF4190 domain-containing protein [Mycolicibacterium mucogenicum]|uniref:DUF4190 domain-containing protein n=1 Tax=Mycolicibacterium mucogenicum TaxID=56689 RepID=UPI002269E842|nr:DUF4190 domain-containing protein [Mycolicibacterium mucogenicum]MCX8556633.1 DUF4190 domain-containing protein [Mycolicibacterium mucogenicum]